MTTQTISLLVALIILLVIALIVLQVSYSMRVTRASYDFCSSQRQINNLATVNYTLGLFNADYRTKVERYASRIYKLERDNTELQRRVNSALAQL